MHVCALRNGRLYSYFTIFYYVVLLYLLGYSPIPLRGGDSIVLAVELWPATYSTLYRHYGKIFY